MNEIECMEIAGTVQVHRIKKKMKDEEARFMFVTFLLFFHMLLVQLPCQHE